MNLPFGEKTNPRQKVFIIRRITYKNLFELTNIEHNFQQKNWGYVDEQKRIDTHTVNILKNISIFFKNIN